MPSLKVGDVVEFITKEKIDYCRETYHYDPEKHYAVLYSIDTYCGIEFVDKATKKVIGRTTRGGFSFSSLRKVLSVEDSSVAKEKLLCLKIKYLWERQYYVRNKHV